MKLLHVRLFKDEANLRDFFRGLPLTKSGTTLTANTTGRTIEDNAASFTVTTPVGVGFVFVNITKGVWDYVETIPNATTLTLQNYAGSENGDSYEIRSIRLDESNVLGIDRQEHGATAVYHFRDTNLYKDASKLAVDSANENQRWLTAANPGTVDATGGTLTAAFGAGVLKVYALPTDKKFHEISVCSTTLDAVAFDFDYQIWAMDIIPGAGAVDNDYFSRGYLLNPVINVIRSNMVSSKQPLIESRATYIALCITNVAVATGEDSLLRIKSFNDGDEVL